MGYKKIAALLLAFAVLATPSLACAYTETDVLNMQGHGTINTQYLVVHSTANPGATAKNHVDYWMRQGNGSTMAHWVIDWTGQCYQMAYSNRLVYHVGYGNRYSCGIEICEATNTSDFANGFDEAARWCADFLKSKGWGIDHMVSHNEARTIWGGTDHTDPDTYFRRYGRTWRDFENLVQQYMSDDFYHDSESSGAYPPYYVVQPDDIPSTSSPSVNTASQTKVGHNLPGGRYRVNCSVLNIRSGHGTEYADVGNYYRGQTVILDNTYYIEDGYVWGTYIAYSGNRRYVAVGKATGKVENSDYLIRR